MSLPSLRVLNRPSSVLFSLLSLSLVLPFILQATHASEIRFNRDIRPLLSDNCFACHGPDEAARKAKLRLDSRADAIREVIVPHHPDQSPLLERVTATHPDEVMPPPETKKGRLTPDEVQRIRQWIAEGAEWEDHWAYIPPQRPKLPEPQAASATILNPIDRFILRRLQEAGLAQSPEADRRTLIRRLSFDLTGFPPAPEQVDQFADDTSPNAYEKLVEHFLRSPHFGERMAMHWLDVVRYADTDGFHGDNYRSVYPYRDYVIAAFNNNLPFDQFTREQLAGDLLPDRTRDQAIASTFNRLNGTTEEGGAQAKEYLAMYAADRVRTVSSAWMGATLGCAQCHDHKFDPYTARDFYSFAAFFADIEEVGVGKPREHPVPTAAQEAELAALDEQINQLQHQLDAGTPELAAAQKLWEDKVRQLLQAPTPVWQPIAPDTLTSSGGAVLDFQEDHSILASETNPPNDTYTVTWTPPASTITAIRLEALPDWDMDKHSLSRGGGNFILTSFEIAALDHDQEHSLPLSRAEADFSQDGWPVSAALDGNSRTGWAVAGHEKAEAHQAVFVLDQPLLTDGRKPLRIRLRHDSPQYKHHNIGRFRLSATALPHPTHHLQGLPSELARAILRPDHERDASQNDQLAAHYRLHAPELDHVRKELAQTREERDRFHESLPRTLMTVSVKPRTTRILPRGNWMDESGPVVEPAVPAFLATGPAKSDGRATRLDLADWLVSRDNPLTARVFVNRLWKLFFGTGLSKVLDDLGSQGEWPHHPELLDWLAAEFMDSGWDIKHMVRLMVMSHTYRQSSLPTAAMLQADPFNRLCASQSRFRLPAELIRDNALSISGLLIDDIGGSSAKPYQPPGYWAQLNFPKREWEADQDRNQYRRGLYTFWCRTFLHPSLLAFDAPSREECTVQRTLSNTPLQALVLLNDPTYVEAARAFAEQAAQSLAPSDPSRLHWMFRQALQRTPDAEEQRILLALLDSQRNHFQSRTEEAGALLQLGLKPAPQDADPVELAAWTQVARAILNLHETITRY